MSYTEELDVKLLYRQMMSNIVFDYLEDTCCCSFTDRYSSITKLQVEEFKNYARVTFEVNARNLDTDKHGDFVRLTGIADVDLHCDINVIDISKFYLTNIEEAMVL